MKRTQLYIDDDLWESLRLHSEQARTSISDLVRQAVREKYASGISYRQQAMRAVVGIWKDRAEVGDPEAYVRRLRKGTRLRRFR
jgi:Ribbon-helix-helix protein, copG family